MRRYGFNPSRLKALPDVYLRHGFAPGDEVERATLQGLKIYVVDPEDQRVLDQIDAMNEDMSDYVWVETTDRHMVFYYLPNELTKA